MEYASLALAPCWLGTPLDIVCVFASAVSAGLQYLASLDIHKVLESTEHLFTSVGILAAGVWAYFNFVKNRTYRPRAELVVGGRILSLQGHKYLVPTVTFRNTGQARIMIEQRGTGVQVHCCVAQPEIPLQELRWDNTGRVYTIFEHHFWIEPTETVTEETQIVPLPAEVIGVRVEARLCALRRRFPSRKNIEYNATAIVLNESGPS